MKTTFRLMFVGLAALTLLLSACTAPGGQTLGEVRSTHQRVADPQVPALDLAALTAGERAFALDLYQQLRTTEGNLFYSPYSITLALAMTYAGARNQTETEMAQTMHYDLAQTALHPAFNGLDQALMNRAANIPTDQGDGFTLSVANALWGQVDYAFQAEFLDLLAENYGAGMQTVDYANDAEGARQLINQWVADETRDKIQDLLQPGAVDSLTRLVLTNAIYFKAGWANTFEQRLTADAPFYKLDGSTVNIPMMHANEGYGYLAGNGFQAVELPYVGGEVSMMVLLPDEGQFEAFESGLNAAQLNEIIAQMGYEQLDLALPKFKVESEFGLGDALQAMGMTQAFSPDADFSGMTGNRELHIGAVVHKAFVDVNEIGTEAAAATAVIMELTMAPAEPVSVTVDRPFLFLIYDNPTGTILFMGRVVAP
ncbi:MAG TPA: serpin family protein [Anaerolineaceae bacterium]|nr:serpin family protein [Anaerolineaceae bacterium]